MRNPFRFLVIPALGSHYPGDARPGLLLCGDVGEQSWEELNIFNAAAQNAGWPLFEGFESAPSYGNLVVENPFWTNTSPSDNCDRPILLFSDLLKETRADFSKIEFPCLNQTALNPFSAFVHHRPALVYQNQDDKGLTTPFTGLPSFDTEGLPIMVSIDEEDATIKGRHFQGDASIPAFYYDEGALPEFLHHTFFQVDYRGWIRTYKLDKEFNIINTESLYEAGDKIVAAAAAPNEAAIYFLSLADRRLHKLTYGGHPLPKAVFTMDKEYGTSPLRVNFDATSSEGYGSPLTYEWDFANGEKAFGAEAQMQFQASGKQVYEVRLLVKDSLGAVDSSSRKVFLNNSPPKIDWINPEGGEKYPLGSSSLLRLSAGAQDQETKAALLSYEWEVYLHHNTHFHPSSKQVGNSTYALISPLGCGEEDYWYRIVLKVADPQGLSTEEELLLYPNCDSNPLQHITLSAFAKDNEVFLTWNSEEIASPIFYEIERSRDYFHYEKIGESSELNFIDEVETKGTFIYRIKAKNEEGAFWYSNLVNKDLPKVPFHRIYPNPSSSIFYFELSDVAGPKAQFDLYDLWGRKIKNLALNALEAAGNKFQINVDGLSKGTYFYLYKDHLQTFAGKIIIN